MKYLLQVFCFIPCFFTAPLFGDANFHQDKHPCMLSNSSLCVPVSSRPDGHAPIGVIGDHGHKRGEWMVSSRLIFSRMKSHKMHKIDTGMFMPSIMYGVTDKFTVMTMASYRYRQHRTLFFTSRQEQQQWNGSISLMGLYSPIEREFYRTLLTFRLLASPRVLGGREIYGTQGAFVFVHYWPRYSIGSQIGLEGLYKKPSSSFFRHVRSEGFVNLWSVRVLNKNSSLSVRLKYIYQKIPANDFHGRSRNLRGAFFYVGGNWVGTDFAHGHRVALEVGTSFKALSPIVILGWQKTF